MGLLFLWGKGQSNMLFLASPSVTSYFTNNKLYVNNIAHFVLSELCTHYVFITF